MLADYPSFEGEQPELDLRGSTLIWMRYLIEGDIWFFEWILLIIMRGRSFIKDLCEDTTKVITMAAIVDNGDGVWCFASKPHNGDGVWVTAAPRSLAVAVVVCFSNRRTAMVVVLIPLLSPETPHHRSTTVRRISGGSRRPEDGAKEIAMELGASGSAEKICPLGIRPSFCMSFSVIPFYTPEESLRLINGKWKLTGQNFPVWKMHLDNILRAQGKFYVLEKPVSRPKSNSPEEEFSQYFKYMADESDVMSILIFSISSEFVDRLRDKSCHEVVKDIESQLGFYKHTGKFLIIKEILSLKLKKDQSVKDHLMEMRRLFKCLTRLGYKMTQEELVYLMWYSLPKEICDIASAYMKEPKTDVAALHENILASLEPKPAPADLMDTDWIDELGDLSCPECGSKDICEHSMNIDQIEIGLPDAPGIFMIDCLITSYESWVIDTGSGNHICNHLHRFTRRKTLRKDRSNLRVGEGTPLIAEAVGSYSLSLPSGLVLELDNCYYIPNMIKNVLSFDLLVDQGFYYKYDYKIVSVFKNNIFYFKATPVNGLYTVNLQDNSNEIYHISKRSKDIEDQTYLWHCRLGHTNKKCVELLLKGGFLGTFDYKPFDNCESCLSGKMTKQTFNKENERATDLLEIIHTDVCGPFSHVARGGYRYFITFTDDFSRYGYVYLMRHKSESFERFREFQNEVQNQLGRKIKFLRSHRGGEYLSDEFDNHLMECGIVSQLTPLYTLQMNGVSERRNRTLLDMVRSMMCHSTLPMSFWGHALETAAHILNRAPTKSVEKTPYEIWKGKKPNISFLRIWGCEVYVKRPTSEKLKPKSDKCFFVGYPRTTVGYYFYNPEENKVFVARNGKFLEEKFLSSRNTRKDVDLQVVDEENTTPIVEPESQHENVEPQSEPIEEVQTQDLRRSSRVRQEPDRYLGFLVSQDSGDLNEPTSYGEAVSGIESEQWQEAMKAEMQSMYDNQVWELTDLPQHCRAVGRKWVFKKKTDIDGNVHTFKARLVAKGFAQTHGIDYDETFSPVAMLKSIWILMAISAYFNYEIWQMDVKTAFLNEKLTEDVYMEQPEGFIDPKNPNKVCKLLKSIYGLKQASRSWNLHFDERIKEFGFAKSEFEPCVYTKFSGSIVTFLVLYVDDILLIGNDVPTLQSVKSWLSKCFQMKDLGEAAYILGIKIYRNRSKRLIGLSQSTYIGKILKKYRMDESKKRFIPMQHGIVLSKTQCPVSSQNQDKMKSVPYASAIGSIMYAMLCTRPDVAYSVSVTSRYQQNLGEPHWVAVKNILKYLRRTKDMFLVFGGSEDEISVNGYSDASFQTDRDDFRSQSGYVFTLNGGAISWKSSKQDTIADSTTKAEYIAASDAAKEAVWLRNFLSDLRVVASVSRPIDIFCDNSRAVAQAKEPREHHKSRHVLRKYHLIREIIGRGDVRICKIPTEENVADPLTKPLARVKHEAHANSIGMQYLDASILNVMFHNATLYIRLHAAGERFRRVEPVGPGGFGGHCCAVSYAGRLGLRRLLLAIAKRLSNDLKPPSYYEARVPMLKLEKEHTKKLLKENELEMKTFGCSLMADGWRDRKERALINLLVNTPQGSMFIGSIDASSYSHTGDNLFKLFDQFIQKVGSDDVQIVTDNASNSVLADIFKLPHLKKVLERAILVNTYIYNRTLLLNMMRDFTGQRDMVRPAKTRFATAFITLNCFGAHKKSLQKNVHFRKVDKSKFAKGGRQTANTILLPNFWNNIDIAVKVGLPLLGVLRLVDGERKPPMGYIYEAMDRAKECIANSFHNKVIKYEEIFTIIDKRWTLQLHRPLHAAGNYLNPALFYNDPNIAFDHEVTKGLFACIHTLALNEVEEEAIHFELPIYRAAQGIFKNPIAIKMRSKLASAEWWAQYGAETPTLQKFVVKVLRLTCSSSGCERNWSVFEHLHSKKRNRLEQQKLNDLVYIKYNRALTRRHDTRDTIDPIILDDTNVQDPHELLMGVLEDEEDDMVHEGEDLTWTTVADAMEVDEPLYATRKSGNLGGAETSTSAAPVRRGAETSTSRKRGRHLVDEDDFDFGEESEEDVIFI
ncbi:hypothetical protein OSB04_001838 [Centaurea solstitialis]|uniref:Integrase catalytic domain-containing protein n=1 Tax=Centaurea solstitialis TaxID=347529 RepID=A0AA38U9V5_9ASTR|nr:hypothetical protein OSB04_001838 [Centaurea solstitialis]